VTTSAFLLVLRYAFLAGLLLFVARVVRTVLSDLDTSAVRAASALFVVEQPSELRGREFLVAGEATIGRAPECAIMLQDGFVSLHHARVFERGGRLWIEDLGSTNGTTLNGQRLRRPAQLRPGDRVAVGDVVLGLRLEPAPGAVPADQPSRRGAQP
jgi:hypothetical protein